VKDLWSCEQGPGDSALQAGDKRGDKRDIPGLAVTQQKSNSRSLNIYADISESGWFARSFYQPGWGFTPCCSFGAHGFPTICNVAGVQEM